MPHPHRDAIVEWMGQQDGPVLFSQVTEQFGRWNPTHAAFNDLIRDKAVEAVFPEAKPGDSGRQFWVLTDG